MGYHEPGDALIALYRKYRVCVVEIAVRATSGELHVGTGFHIGDGWIVTARHVIEGGAIEHIAGQHHASTQSVNAQRVITPTDPEVDLALLKTDFSLAYYMSDKFTIHGVPQEWKEDHIPIGGHLDDWIGDELVLSRVLLLGFPRVPQSRQGDLVAADGRVSAVVDRYAGARHPHFIISPLGRGGFSGGPVISEYGFLLGVMTETLFHSGQLPEMGFAAALSVEPLWNLLHENGLYLASNADFLRELYDEQDDAAQ